MTARLDIHTHPVVAKAIKHLATAGTAMADSALPPATRELVLLRCSQINGCGMCVDMHTKEAARSGESSVRLHLVATWRDSTVFTEAERAALALAEEGTRIADAAGGVPDDVWENAVKHYDEDQLGALLVTITVINAFNRLNVITRQAGGAYVPGQLG
ncbi:carboxymuconolactone decarboxylase family protein [Streptomyces cavernicola]|uniref:Carboxymuconolactone decarboxylase family protein n=1 Tax=Streptomyces cavernicola TaxID=3043613 RepID=A0ABT6S6M6_9ACTN|nr:carboxymuconolactone decarboxylase family protein [Streptomyces sp. B-S-A6]MDI3403746.1 carboxymuconolactone decarboxylase family protein [Streptomyces sp. B-S-A6]